VGQKVLGTSDRIPVEGTTGTRRHIFEFPVGEIVRPGHAFVYQVYGVHVDEAGEERGFLSEAQCLRFSPPDPETGLEVEPAKCGGCTVDHAWLKKTPIKVVRPLSHHPSDKETLGEMLPEGCIALSVLAEDVDILKQTCVGCTPDTAIKRIGPIAHGIKYSWTKNGVGKLLTTDGPTIFYKLPPTAPRTPPQKVTVTCRIENVPGKAQDDFIEGKVKFEIQEKDSTKCLSVKVKVEAPKEKQYDEDCEEKEAEDCNPEPEEWKKGKEIDGKLAIADTLCPNALAILRADYTDNDLLKLTCKALTCGEDWEEFPLNDPLLYTWSDGGAGGSFPLGSNGKYVLYKAPPDSSKSFQFQVNIDDSGTQYDDKEKKPQKPGQVEKLLDLVAVNTNQTGRWSNITAGRSHRIEPEWEPASTRIKKVEWEIDLGGKEGKIKKVLYGTNLTKDQASLRLTTQKKDKAMQLSWLVHPHTHGIRTIKCRIWGESCGDCCVCEDSTWSRSDFAGRDTLEWNQFKLFFEKGEFKDNGKVADGGAVGEEDEYGEKTKVNDRTCSNWFLHWSGKTYGTCEHDHDLADPKIMYQRGRTIRYTQGSRTTSATCNGLYVQDNNTLWLTDGASERSRRGAWHSAIPRIETSDKRWVDTSEFQQAGYNIRGHQECNRVFLHEYGHYVSMTRNWRPGGEWHRAYGARSTEDTATNDVHNNLLASNLQITLRPTGNYNGTREPGRDSIQKFNMTIVVSQGTGRRQRQVATINFNDAWIEGGIGRNNVSWQGRGANAVGTVNVRGGFEIMNGTDKWVFRIPVLRRHRRANDADDDFVPNLVEDTMGLKWNSSATHHNHARGHTRTRDGHPQRPDQEFFADQYVFDRWDQVEPGHPELDWANPGAQSQPPYE
jgi:hypothetical protein